jgi:hypothetical protein
MTGVVRTLVATTTIVFGVLVWVSLALAGDSAVSGYAGQAGGIEDQVETSAAVGTGGVVETGGALPFTGLDLGLLVAGGLLLLGAGLVMRRLGREKS